MKTKSLVVLSIAVITLCNATSAQYAPKTDGAYINGLKVGDKCTMAQLINVFGKPDKIEHDIEYPDLNILYYGKDVLYWYCIDNKGGKFHGGEWTTNKYNFCGTVKVGDSISNIEKLRGIANKYVGGSEFYAGVIYWKPNYPDPYKGKWEWLRVRFFYNNNGKIVRISVEIPFI